MSEAATVAAPERRAETLRGMVWGVKSSFVAYVAGMPDGAVSATDGAVPIESAFGFPVADDRGFDRRTGVGTLEFAGDVRFRAHGGMLRVRIARPRLTAGTDGASVTILDAYGERRELAWLGLPQPLAGGGLRIPAVLAPAGVPYFNDVYPQGSDLDPILIRGV